MNNFEFIERLSVVGLRARSGTGLTYRSGQQGTQ